MLTRIENHLLFGKPSVGSGLVFGVQAEAFLTIITCRFYLLDPANRCAARQIKFEMLAPDARLRVSQEMAEEWGQGN